MAPSGNVERKSTALSAAGIATLAILIIVAIAIIVYFVINDDLWDELATLAVGAIVVIAIIAVVILIAIGIIALPMYAYKGEQWQTDASYDLNDVESVKETDSDKKEAH